MNTAMYPYWTLAEVDSNSTAWAGKNQAAALNAQLEAWFREHPHATIMNPDNHTSSMPKLVMRSDVNEARVTYMRYSFIFFYHEE